MRRKWIINRVGMYHIVKGTPAWTADRNKATQFDTRKGVVAYVRQNRLGLVLFEAYDRVPVKEFDKPVEAIKKLATRSADDLVKPTVKPTVATVVTFPMAGAPAVAAGLPPVSYASLPSSPKEVIQVLRGVKGYYVRPLLYGASVDELNKSMGVTHAQAEAMLAGSMFGWHVPAADPAYYTAREKSMQAKPVQVVTCLDNIHRDDGKQTRDPDLLMGGTYVVVEAITESMGNELMTVRREGTTGPDLVKPRRFFSPAKPKIEEGTMVCEECGTEPATHHLDTFNLCKGCFQARDLEKRRRSWRPVMEGMSRLVNNCSSDPKKEARAMFEEFMRLHRQLQGDMLWTLSAFLEIVGACAGDERYVDPRNASGYAWAKHAADLGKR
jgi:hypothetical protein